MKREEVRLTDDITGGPATQTVTFGLDGVAYSVDVSDTNAVRLREFLGEYIAAGQRLGRYLRGAPSRPPARGESDDIREWARANGHQVADRGPIPREVREAFSRRHGPRPK